MTEENPQARIPTNRGSTCALKKTCTSSRRTRSWTNTCEREWRVHGHACAWTCVCAAECVHVETEGRTRGALSRHRVSRQTAWQLLDLFIRLAYLATYIRTSLCTVGSRSNKHPVHRAKYRLYLWTRPSNLSIRTTNANSNLCSPGSHSKYPGLTPGSFHRSLRPTFYDLWRDIRTEGEIIVGIELQVVAEVSWKQVRTHHSMY